MTDERRQESRRRYSKPEQKKEAAPIERRLSLLKNSDRAHRSGSQRPRILRPAASNPQGAATIAELQLQISGVAIHQKNDRRWAQLPARPQINKDGAAIRGDDGKIAYSPVISFTSRAVADAFSARVIESLVKNYGDVFKVEETAS